MDTSTKRLIAALFVPAFMIGTDFTGAMMLAMPIERAFSVDITTTQWVPNVYALVLAVTCVSGGRLGDMYGHRRFMVIGLAVFLAASIVCTVAPTIGWLIGARAVQGLGAAMAWPCILAVGSRSVPDDQRGVAMGLLFGAVAIGNVVAPFVAGILSGVGFWRGFYLFNVLLAAASMLLVWRTVPRTPREPTEERIDFGGMAVLGLALLALLLALDVGADWGWFSGGTLLLLVLAIAAFIAFPAMERFVADPILPPALTRNRQLMLALAGNGFASPALYVVFLYVPQYLHKVHGWSNLWSSVGVMPTLISLAVINVTAGRLYNPVGPRLLLIVGHALTVAGMLCLALFEPDWGYAAMIVPLLLVGAGGGLIFGPAGTACVNAVAPSRAGLAGGLGFMGHLTLGAIGLAVATTLLFAGSGAVLTRGLAARGVDMPAAARDILNGSSIAGGQAREILARYGAEVQGMIVSALSDAFAAGAQLAFWVALAFAALGLALSFWLDDDRLGRVRPKAPA